MSTLDISSYHDENTRISPFSIFDRQDNSSFLNRAMLTQWIIVLNGHVSYHKFLMWNGPPSSPSVVSIVESIVFTGDDDFNLLAARFEEESRLFGGQKLWMSSFRITLTLEYASIRDHFAVYQSSIIGERYAQWFSMESGQWQLSEHCPMSYVEWNINPFTHDGHKIWRILCRNQEWKINEIQIVVWIEVRIHVWT